MTKTLFGAIALIFLLHSTTSPALSQNQTAYDGPGFEAYYPEESMLFLKGGEDSPFLDRNWTTVTGLPSGSASFSKTSSITLPTIVQAAAPQFRSHSGSRGTLQSDFMHHLKPQVMFALLQTSPGWSSGLRNSVLSHPHNGWDRSNVQCPY